MKPRKPFLVPVTREAEAYLTKAAAGSMIDWAYGNSSRYDWKQPTEFEGSLHLIGATRGRSAVTFDLRSITNVRYLMRLKEFTEMVKATDVRSGRVEGVFGYKKQGQNISLTFIREISRGGGLL